MCGCDDQGRAGRREGGREGGRAGGRTQNVLETVDCGSPRRARILLCGPEPGETPENGVGPGCSSGADKAKGMTRAKGGVGERVGRDAPEESGKLRGQSGGRNHESLTTETERGSGQSPAFKGVDECPFPVGVMGLCF